MFITDVTFFDLWTLWHAFVALMMGMAGHFLKMKKYMIISTGTAIIVSWEIIEQKKLILSSFFTPEQPINIFSDVLVGVAFLILGASMHYKDILKMLKRK